MALPVFLTAGAERDLDEIADYIVGHDSPQAAERVLERLEQALEGLGEFPLRGDIPRELADLGLKEYREIVSRPYRIVYRVTNEGVFVFLVADGRRDFQSLLARRLLRA